MNCKYLLICCTAILYLLSSCVEPFELQGIKEKGGDLVVEGMIMETGTTIKLSRTVGLYDDASNSSQNNLENVYDANVQVIDDRNNIVAIADPQFIDGKASAVYAVSGEITFTPGTKYALTIQIGEKHYQSAFVSPVRTPEIDEINWRKNTDGSMDIMVSTHDPENKTKYYCWAFEEDWEIMSEVFGYFRYEQATREVIEQSMFTSNNRYYCWASDKSKSIILGTSDRLTEATIKNKIINNFPTYNTRFSYLYSILVKQYGLDKDAYAYLENLRKNIDSGGNLFSPIITELKGNINCLSNPDEQVIGYIAATNEVKTRIFINMLDIGGADLYTCGVKLSLVEKQLVDLQTLGYGIETFLAGSYICAPIRCVDCTARGGTKNKPDFWPNDHQ